LFGVKTSVRDIDKLHVSQPDAEFAVSGPYSIGRLGFEE
jgi:hypothetical protein